MRTRMIWCDLKSLAVFALTLLLFSFGIADAEEISVTQWGNSLYGLPYAVAMDKGLFKHEGIDITGIIGSGGGGTTVRNILASETPYGEVAVAAALAAARQGLDLVIVNVGTRSVAESSVVTMPDSGIQSVDDLIGKKIAVTSPKSVSEMLFLLVLQTKKIDASKITRVYSGGYGPGLTMLEQGAVSAATLIEPLSIIKKDRYRTIVAARNVLPPMTTSVGITTREFAKAHPEKLRAIIAGRRAGVDFIYAHPSESAVILQKSYSLAPDVAHEAVENMVGPKMWSEGEFNQTELDRMVEALRLIDEVKGKVDWSALIDASFLPADLKGSQ